MCSFRKYPYSPNERGWKFLGGGGFLKTKKFKEMYEVELSRGVGGSYKKSLPCGRYGYFMELHNFQKKKPFPALKCKSIIKSINKWLIN